MPFITNAPSVISKNVARTTSVKIAIPTTANALFSANENQAAKPLNRPKRGPKLRSIKKYVPPAFGMAVVNSALLSTEGKIRIDATKYERTTPEPALEQAIAGKTNKPELIIAPDAMQNTPQKPNCFFSCAT